MHTLNSQTKLSGFKKIQFKDGICQVEFFDLDANEIKVKVNDTPHPDFTSNFLSLASWIKTFLGIEYDTTVYPTSIQFPEAGIMILTGTIHKEFDGEIKTGKINLSELDIDESYQEFFDLVKTIKDETEEFIFRGKTAQQSLPFAENEKYLKAV